MPNHAHIHLVFHVTLLKCVVGSFSSLPPVPQQLSGELELLVDAKVLRGVRPHSNPTYPTVEILIEWKNMPECEASWEPFMVVKEKFPTFHLSNKMSLQPMGRETKKDGMSSLLTLFCMRFFYCGGYAM